jgi:hypothetical protein
VLIVSGAFEYAHRSRDALPRLGAVVRSSPFLDTAPDELDSGPTTAASVRGHWRSSRMSLSTKKESRVWPDRVNLGVKLKVTVALSRLHD